MPVLFIIVAGHITNVCVTLFLHRAQTHRGVRLHALAATPMRVWLWLTTAIVTKEWVACHRKHHAFADREGDPHSPVMEGLREIMLKGAFYYRKAIKQPGMLEKYGRNPQEFGYNLSEYLRGVISALQHKRAALVDGLEGRKSLELITGIYESIETNTDVQLRFRPKKCRLGLAS